MQESSIPLTVFRPETFYRWLFRQWHRPGGLSQASCEALSQIHSFLAQDGPQQAPTNSVRHLLTVVDCAVVLLALADEDFGQFIDWVLEQPFPEGVTPPAMPIDHGALDVSLAKLRQQLARHYDQERIWPNHGMRPLLSEALDAACQAEKAVLLAQSVVAVSQRERAAQQTHDGVDRCLLCVEHFLELLVEFAAVVARYAQVADVEEQRSWLKQAGIDLTQDDTRISWNSKQQTLQTIRKKIETRDQAPEGWEHLWATLLQMMDHFRDSSPKRCGLKHLDELRLHRNSVHHAGHTLAKARSIPTAYQEAIPGIRAAVSSLQTSSQDLLPGRARILEYRRDYTGGIELALALEDHRLVTLRYVHERDAYLISGIALGKLSNQLAFAPGEQEYFIYPIPQADEQLIINALLLPSERPGEPIEKIRIRPEAIAVAPPVEFAEELVVGT